MRDQPTYSVMSAVHRQSGEQRFVIVDRDGRMHSAGTAWLQFLSDSGKSPHTAREYGRRAAWYLSWCAQTMDWRKATLSHIALWRQTVAATPVVKTNGKPGTRSASTVKLWIVAVRSFYEWADAHELPSTDLLSRMTQLKYFAPGTPAGGEFGVTRRVLADSLRSVAEGESTPQWITDAGARANLGHLVLPTRDRFLVDLLTTTGIRVGEALPLLLADMHFGGGSRLLRLGRSASRCRPRRRERHRRRPEAHRHRYSGIDRAAGGNRRERRRTQTMSRSMCGPFRS
ncbi:MAG: hypothetical protein EOP24_40310 [Hyphomicrobiales bacterium]|jgi:hypothetical protein|nr:MAG: hypothetical protein EOP24_40310 [Hyphomicrobiales bacterium]